jgi:uncharacterized membrane protein YphA (DoxX/SURF4 family)
LLILTTWVIIPSINKKTGVSLLKKSINSIFFLQLSLALMFIAIGILGLTNYNSEFSQIGRSMGKLFGKSNNIIPILFSIIQLLAGVLLLLSLFMNLSNKLLSLSLLVIFVFWAVNIALAFFTKELFRPDFIVWLSKVAPQLVILSSLWLVYRGQE